MAEGPGACCIVSALDGLSKKEREKEGERGPSRMWKLGASVCSSSQSICRDVRTNPSLREVSSYGDLDAHGGAGMKSPVRSGCHGETKNRRFERDIAQLLFISQNCLEKESSNS